MSRITIKSHSAVSKTVTKCLRLLNPETKDVSTASTVSTVLEITADARVAGKAITIVEIVKRRIIEHGETISQTTKVQEKPATENPSQENTGLTHLQGQGYQKTKKKLDGQIIIRLERTQAVKS